MKYGSIPNKIPLGVNLRHLFVILLVKILCAVEHSLALWVMLTFHISLKTSDFLVPIIFFLVTKKNFYQNFRISFEYVPEYVSFQIS